MCNFSFFKVAAQVEEMSAEANKERKLRARSDQVELSESAMFTFVKSYEFQTCFDYSMYYWLSVLFVLSQYAKQLEEEIEYLKVQCSAKQ